MMNHDTLPKTSLLLSLLCLRLTPFHAVVSVDISFSLPNPLLMAPKRDLLLSIMCLM